jgi:activator of HSP90 ATPase
MPSIFMSRRALACGIAAAPIGLGAAARVIPAAHGDGLSRSAEAIRQEIHFDAGRKRVFDALTVSEQFDAVTRLSDAAALAAAGSQPTAISSDAGGHFTLFGGYITGRHLELLAEERLVQAWRAASWKPGEYSVARFTLADHGAGTKLILDHRGFPDGQGAHLARGWHLNYWKPLAMYLLRA